MVAQVIAGDESAVLFQSKHLSFQEGAFVQHFVDTSMRLQLASSQATFARFLNDSVHCMPVVSASA